MSKSNHLKLVKGACCCKVNYTSTLILVLHWNNGSVTFAWFIYGSFWLKSTQSWVAECASPSPLSQHVCITYMETIFSHCFVTKWKGEVIILFWISLRLIWLHCIYIGIIYCMRYI